MNSQTANDNYSPEYSFVVNSAAFVRVEFGSINLPSFPNINAILVEFHSGATYLYVAVPNDVYAMLLGAVGRHIATDGHVRVGGLFSNVLFNHYASYARLNG